MKIFRRLMAALPAVLLLALLSACSQSGGTALGVYDCAQLRFEGESYDVTEVYQQPATLELKKGGKAQLTLGDAVFPGTWSAENGAFTLVTDAGTSHGSLQDGVCTLDYLDSGLVHVFLRAGAVLPPAADGASAPDAEQTALQERWNGDWYGWWSIENATGDWAELDGQWYDCFARIAIDENGEGSMVLWDEQLSAEVPMGEIELAVVQATEEAPMGIAASRGGSFWLSEIAPDAWQLDPAAYGFENMLVVDHCRYESDEGSFDYQIVLRPWGTLWKDVEAQAAELLPYYYKSWYLPMLDAGETMPDSFDATAVVRNEDTGEEHSEE